MLRVLEHNLFYTLAYKREFNVKNANVLGFIKLKHLLEHFIFVSGQVDFIFNLLDLSIEHVNDFRPINASSFLYLIDPFHPIHDDCIVKKRAIKIIYFYLVMIDLNLIIDFSF